MKTSWTDLTIINVKTQTEVTSLDERLRVLRIYRQLGYCNGFCVKDGAKIARIDSTSWIGFTFE